MRKGMVFLAGVYPYEPWQVTETGFDPQEVKKNESVFALGNGYLGLRGNHEEGLSDPALSLEGTYINAFYETEKIKYGEIAYAYAEESQTMLNVSNGKRLRLCVDGVEFHMDTAHMEAYRRTLSMQDGTLTRSLIWVMDSGKRIKVESARFVSMEHRNIAAIRYAVTALNFDGDVVLDSVLDGDVTNLTCENDPRVGSGLQGRALGRPQWRRQGETGMALAQCTKNTRLCVACAAETGISGCEAVPQPYQKEYQGGVRYVCTVRQGETAVLTKMLAYVNGGAQEAAELLSRAAAFAAGAMQTGYEALLARQKAFFEAFWAEGGLTIDGDDALLQGLRFNMFHLLQSVGRDGRTNISAKGLTGEGYEGHYFWDTETYVLPMFLYCAPQISRALLEYRYSILDSARSRAREMGHPRGALYPWRTINGNECSAYYPAGTAQYHINADIAFAVKQYVQVTGDDAFLIEYGAEMLVETARLWYDLGFFNPRRDGRFCINGVTGPDEYNAIVDNNCYTNLMARENLSYAVQALAFVRRHDAKAYAALCEKLGLGEQEPEQWKTAADRMYIPYDAQTGIYLQDDGFMDRKPWPLDQIPKENFPLLLHYHPLVIYRHRVCKQADMILALFLLRDRFSLEEKTRCFNYYDRVTTHDSSLSMATFSVIASEIGYAEKAYRYFHGTARLDLDDAHNNTKDGLHMANMAGTWMCVVNGFAGMHAGENGLSFAPVLPQGWRSYGFSLHFRGRCLRVEIDAKGARFTRISGEPLALTCNGQTMEI